MDIIIKMFVIAPTVGSVNIILATYLSIPLETRLYTAFLRTSISSLNVKQRDEPSSVPPYKSDQIDEKLKLHGSFYSEFAKSK